MLAHTGLGVSVLGVVITTAWSSENILEMKAGDKTEVGAYTIRYDRAMQDKGPNYLEDAALFTILKGNAEVAATQSSKRVYPARQSATTEAGITTFGLSQLYLSIGDKTPDGRLVVRIWWKPWILCVWGGALIMAFGGLVSLSDRRLRAEGGGKRSGGSGGMRALLALVFLLLASLPAHAVNPDEVLADPALEARARALSGQLRCMVCQNQSIDDSNADLARDLRLLVRERLKDGDSDAE
eukprot:gene57785-79171_t